MDQTEMETQLRKLQADFAGLCKLFAVQQQALETLAAAVKTHQQVMEVQTGYVPPDPRRATEN